MKHFEYYRKSDDPNKDPEIQTILDKKLYMVVNRHHRPIYHKDGHLMLFSRKKDAERWLEKNQTEDWRIEKLNIYIFKE